MSDYLVCLSKDDLTFPVKFFKSVKQTQDSEIIEMIDDMASLALDCVYACDDLDMYEKAKDILDSILKDYNGKSSICSLLEQCEGELDCIRLLNKYGVKTTLKFIQQNKNDLDIAKSLLVQMAKSLNKRYIENVILNDFCNNIFIEIIIYLLFQFIASR